MATLLPDSLGKSGIFNFRSAPKGEKGRQSQSNATMPALPKPVALAEQQLSFNGEPIRMVDTIEGTDTVYSDRFQWDLRPRPMVLTGDDAARYIGLIP